jgi:hypothetical protein
LADIEKAQEAYIVPSRLKLGEYGSVGLRQINGHILEESRKELRFPESLKTFRKMGNDATIASALSLFEMMIERVNWDVDIGETPSPEMVAKGQFLKECLNDMEHSWRDFIREVTSIMTYGFSVHEKVFRKRRHSFGSKYNDNKIGIRKLPIRAQDTLSEWMFSEDGRDLLGVKQDLSMIENGLRYLTLGRRDIIIPRNKFLLFRTGVKRDNPEGKSPLVACYYSWKYRTLLEEQESVGVARELTGLPLLKIPPRYMSADASDSERQIYDYYKQVIRNIQNNEQGGLIIPQAFDPESRQPLFEFSLMSVEGSKMYDTDGLVRRWDAKILTSLLADILRMGQDSVGSYALASEKSSIMRLACESRLREIQDVLNNDLVKQLFAINGYAPDEELPSLKYVDFDAISMDEFSKAIQRMFSVGAVEFDRPVANRIRRALGVDQKPDTEPVDKESLSTNSSKAASGMAVGKTGEGTSDDPFEMDDASVGNLENS